MKVLVVSSILLHKLLVVLAHTFAFLAFCACTCTTIYQIFLGNENFLIVVIPKARAR